MSNSDPITLPSEQVQQPRGRMPLIAAAVPLISGVAIWAITGSIMALGFAAIGPLMMVAGVVEARLTGRRERRAARLAAEQQWADAESALRLRHDALRARLWRQQPGLAECLGGHRSVRERLSAKTMVVLGSGEQPVPHETRGGDDECAAEFRRRASRVGDVPVAVPLGSGISIKAPEAIAQSIVRAIVLQLCARYAATELALVGEGVAGLGLCGMPHAQHPEPAAFRLGVLIADSNEVAADATIEVLLAQSSQLSTSCVVDASNPARAVVFSEGEERTVALAGVSAVQTPAIAAVVSGRELGRAAIATRVLFSELPAPAQPQGSLVAAIGRDATETIFVDLVADGPHAIVTGMTGSGKSELLLSWVASLARNYRPAEVCFVLADFKGGTAFDALNVLPHVTAVITDLDGEGARRGVESLRAELRRREAVLAQAGARDIASPGVQLPRLVIVVDEFAALVAEHPELVEVFTDIAARGRALGMHLVLGTQRATGVFREALMANCPLRLSLRVSDTADSRVVVGSDEAAQLPGDLASRGLAIVRRPRDAVAHRFRVALSEPDDLAAIAKEHAGAVRPAAPWLPPLPRVLSLEELATRGEAPAGELLLGLMDLPDQQAQRAVGVSPGSQRGLMVLGGPASGKTAVLATLAAQFPSAVVVPQDLEGAWDMTCDLARTLREGLVLCDDFDGLLSAFPPEYAAEFLGLWEQVIRAAPAAGATIVLSAQRLGSGTARLAELLPRRLLLGYPNRGDYVAAGGSPQDFLPGCPPGRGRMDDGATQVAWTSEPLPAAGSASNTWRPDATTAIVAPHSARVIELLRARHPEFTVTSVGDLGAPGQPGAPGASEVGEASPMLIVGDGEEWQRAWPRWQQLRATADVLVLAECASDLRTLAGVRELPPFAHPHRGRAWLIRAGGPPRRVVGLD
jgi:S-DNA-T family DNA segregation ATPase FtsK/SpoIIIE